MKRGGGAQLQPSGHDKSSYLVRRDESPIQRGDTADVVVAAAVCPLSPDIGFLLSELSPIYYLFD